MPLQCAYAVWIYYKVAAQHSILHYTPPRLLQHSKKASLGIHTLGDNFLQTKYWILAEVAVPTSLEFDPVS